MFNESEYQQEYLQNLPHELVRLVDKCQVLPHVEPDGASECAFAEALYFSMEETKLEVLKLRTAHTERIEELRQRIVAVQETSTKPGWATEDDCDAGSDRFDEYCREVKEAENQIQAQVKDLKVALRRLQIERAIIEEILVKVARKNFPGGPKSQGRRPGDPLPTTRELLDPSPRVRRFLES